MFKEWKKCDFCKGVNPWFWSKIGLFSIFCFQAIEARKMCFTILQNKKTPFQAIKTACSKSGKNVIFAKGVTHGFGTKVAIFPSFVFRQYRAGKCVLRYSRTIKTPFQAIKTASSKSGKNVIFAKALTHGFGTKLAIFPCFFLGNIGQENVFYYSLERKSAFLGYKNSMFKKWKKCDFCKGVNPWFWSKIGHFSMFFFQAIQVRKMCFTIFQNQKTPLQAIKTRSSKS